MEARASSRNEGELIAVLLTAFGKFLFMDYLEWRFFFVSTATLGWLGYIIYQKRSNPGVLKEWGFRTDNFQAAVRLVLPFGLVALLAMITIGYLRSTLNPSWHLFPVLITYPLWGMIQQFLLIALLAGNLRRLDRPVLSKAAVILLTALLFAAIHYPIWPLIGATFILALFYGYVYLKEPNIYVLGLFHGWLGGVFYYTVMNVDPFLNTFGHLIYGS